MQLMTVSDPGQGRQETHENRRDVFILSTPLQSGSVRLEERGGRVLFDGVARPGMLRVLSPGDSERVTRRTPLTGAVIAIPGPRFRLIAAQQRGRERDAGSCLVEPMLDVDPRVELIGRSLACADAIDPHQRSLFVEGLTLSLLSLILRRPSAGHVAGGLTDAELSRCIDYAESRMTGRLDIEAWAASLGLTSSDFLRRFSRRMRVSPYAWFLDRRIERSRDLLARRDMTLSEIALEVGFSSQSHFTEAFRRRVGAPPGRWRQLAGTGFR